MAKKIFKNKLEEVRNTIKNRLRGLPLDHSLYVIWAYFCAIQYKQPFPTNIIVSRDVANKILNKSHNQLILPHLLMVLIQELIIWNREDFTSVNSLKDWTFFSKTYNKINQIWSEVDGSYIDSTDFNRYFSVLSNHEFEWQNNLNFVDINRYYNIYNTSRIDSIVQKKIGISLKQLYQRAIMIWLNSFNSPFCIDTNSKTDTETDERMVLIKVMNYLSKDIMYFKQEFGKLRGDTDIIYNHSPLFDYPIIELETSRYYCMPVPYLLLRKVTVGLYYDLKADTNFSNFGKSFEKYVGKIIDKSFPEKIGDNGDRRGNTVDWIIKDNSCLLFIECKSRNLFPQARAELKISTRSKQNMDDMIDSLVQGYKSIKRYLEDDYPNLAKTDLPIYLMISTIEDWNFYQLTGDIDTILTAKLVGEGINPNYIEKYPYIITPIVDLEIFIKVAKESSINEIMSKKTYQDHRRWYLSSFLNRYYKVLSNKYIAERENEAEKNCINLFL